MPGLDLDRGMLEAGRKPAEAETGSGFAKVVLFENYVS